MVLAGEWAGAGPGGQAPEPRNQNFWERLGWTDGLPGARVDSADPSFHPLRVWTVRHRRNRASRAVHSAAGRAPLSDPSPETPRLPQAWGRSAAHGLLLAAVGEGDPGGYGPEKTPHPSQGSQSGHGPQAHERSPDGLVPHMPHCTEAGRRASGTHLHKRDDRPTWLSGRGISSPPQGATRVRPPRTSISTHAALQASWTLLLARTSMTSGPEPHSWLSSSQCWAWPLGDRPAWTSPDLSRPPPSIMGRVHITQRSTRAAADHWPLVQP